MWETVFSIARVDTDQLDEMIKVCEDISRKDPSFKFKIVGDNLNIYSETKNKAHRRGVWLINNSEPFSGMGYNVYYSGGQ